MLYWIIQTRGGGPRAQRGGGAQTASPETSARTDVYMYVCMYIHIYIYIHIEREREMYTHSYAYKYIRIYMCVYIYIYIYIHVLETSTCVGGRPRARTALHDALSIILVLFILSIYDYLYISHFCPLLLLFSGRLLFILKCSFSGHFTMLAQPPSVASISGVAPGGTRKSVPS